MVKGYVDKGLEKKYLRDPENVVNLMKKKAKLGVLEKAELDISASLPKEDLKWYYDQKVTLILPCQNLKP